MGRVQVAQRMDDVDRDVGACAAAGFPDRSARSTDEKLRGARRLAEPVRRADDRIVPVQDGVPREVFGEPQLLDEVRQRSQLAAPQIARTLFCHDRSSLVITYDVPPRHCAGIQQIRQPANLHRYRWSPSPLE